MRFMGTSGFETEDALAGAALCAVEELVSFAVVSSACSDVPEFSVTPGVGVCADTAALP
jgi:hypothetical protein